MGKVALVELFPFSLLAAAVQGEKSQIFEPLDCSLDYEWCGLQEEIKTVSTVLVGTGDATIGMLDFTKA